MIEMFLEGLLIGMGLFASGIVVSVIFAVIMSCYIFYKDYLKKELKCSSGS